MALLILLCMAGAAVAYAVANHAARRADAAGEELARLRIGFEALGRRVTELRLQLEKLSPGSTAASEKASAKGEAAESVAKEAMLVVVPDPLGPVPISDVPPLVAEMPAVEAPVPVGVPYLLPPAAFEADGEAPTASAFEAAAESSIPPPPPPATHLSPPPTQPSTPFDWEGLVGVKLFSWIAGIALALAGIFFLRYSVEHGWLSAPVRAVIGIATGASLIFICELRIARDYKFTANAMHGAAIAILYSTLFATYALWHLASATIVFGAMLLVTAVAVALSIRRDSIFIALLGLLGGFATPALLSTGENKPIGLFSYLLLLNVGLSWVAMKKRWPVLTALTIAFTVLYQWAWIARFLSVGQLPLAAVIFLVFALMAATAVWIGREGDEKQAVFDRISAAGVGLPLLFAAFAAAVPAYGARYNILFGFLLLMSTGLSIIARLRGPQWLHHLSGISIALVFLIWSAASYKPQAWPVIVGWVAVFVVTQLALSYFSSNPKLTIAPLLFFMFPALIALEPRSAAPLLVFGALFALLALVAAYAIVKETAIVYFAAAFFTIASEAIWSAKYLTPERLMNALAIYGVFALFFLGVPLIARRYRREFQTGNAITVLLLASLALLFFLAAGPVAKMALWGLALLLGVVNAGAMFEARTSSRPLIASAGIVLSWIVIAVWCATSIAATNVIAGLAVIGGFAILAVAGNVWGSKGGDPGGTFQSATFLGLAGHVFLMFIAAQTHLAFPPWPLFAVLFVLDLAIGVAAIYLQRDRLMVAAMAASQLVLLIWSTHAAAAPWPHVALVATLVIAAMALVWFAISRAFTLAATVALFLGSTVAMVAGSVSSKPLMTPLLLTHVLILLALLAVAWIMELHDIAVLAVPVTALATGLSRAAGPGQQLAFAGAIYAIFISYPFMVGARAKGRLQPYLAAVLASVPFFFFARRAILEAGYGYSIGVLPVVQALLMVALVVRLLRIEPPGERSLSRLALVSAAALAFVTVAIPLQLDKQWITIGWALEGAALVWLFTRIPHRGLLLWAGVLLSAVFVRLVFNPAVFAYHPVSHVPIVNWYLYTYLDSAAPFFFAAYLLPRTEKDRQPWAVPALCAAGTVLLFFLVNIEIADFYSTGTTLTFNFFSSSLAQDLTYTMAWALFAIGMLVAGILLRSRAARIAAILLLVVTVLKCFLHDLGRLGGLYRVGSLLGLAASLVLVGILLQRFVMVRAARPAPAGDAS